MAKIQQNNHFGCFLFLLYYSDMFGPSGPVLYVLGILKLFQNYRHVSSVFIMFGNSVDLDRTETDIFQSIDYEL